MGANFRLRLKNLLICLMSKHRSKVRLISLVVLKGYSAVV
uniref:Uncharacterized protein n=1 Tax=Arundo donax TaxID=35708 RepID=A0A0A9A5G2_ARUDO